MGVDVDVDMLMLRKGVVGFIWRCAKKRVVHAAERLRMRRRLWRRVCMYRRAGRFLCSARMYLVIGGEFNGSERVLVIWELILIF